MSNIPLGREELLELASEVRKDGNLKLASKIEAIVFGRLFRTITKDRSPVSSVPMDATVARRIVRMHHLNPEMSTQKIADLIGVNPGRVSEAIAGKW